jgi:hypothetical protein
MQTVFPGERRLKRRILLRIYKEKIANLIRKILRKKPIKFDEKDSDEQLD